MTQFFYLPFQLPVFPCSSSTNMGQQDQITGPENRASRYHRCDRLLSPYNFHNGWIFFVGQATRHRLNLVLPFQRRSWGSDRRIVLLTRIFLSIFASEYRGEVYYYLLGSVFLRVIWAPTWCGWRPFLRIPPKESPGLTTVNKFFLGGIPRTITKRDTDPRKRKSVPG